MLLEKSAISIKLLCEELTVFPEGVQGQPRADGSRPGMARHQSVSVIWARRYFAPVASRAPT